MWRLDGLVGKAAQVAVSHMPPCLVTIQMLFLRDPKMPTREQYEAAIRYLDSLPGSGMSLVDFEQANALAGKPLSPQLLASRWNLGRAEQDETGGIAGATVRKELRASFQRGIENAEYVRGLLDSGSVRKPKKAVNCRFCKKRPAKNEAYYNTIPRCRNCKKTHEKGFWLRFKVGCLGSVLAIAAAIIGGIVTSLFVARSGPYASLPFLVPLVIFLIVVVPFGIAAHSRRKEFLRRKGVKPEESVSESKT